MTSYTMSWTKRAAQCKSLAIRGRNQSKWDDARGSSHFNILCRQTRCNFLWVREEAAWWLNKLYTGFQKKGVMDSNSERQPAGEEIDPQVWIPFPFKAALTVHFYLISPGRKRKFPVGSGCEGKTIWSWVALGYAPLPSNPRWWPEWTGEGDPQTTVDLALERRPKLSNVANFQTKTGLYTMREWLGRGWKAIQPSAPVPLLEVTSP